MKKRLIQPCVLMIIALSTLAYGCKEEVADIGASVKIESIGDPTETEVSVRFTPEKGVTQFAYAIGDASDYESFLDGTIVGYTKVLNGEMLEKTFDQLDPNMRYTIFSMALTSQDVPYGVSEFGVQTGPMAFAATKYYVTDVSAGFQVNMTHDYYKYAYYFGSPDDKEKFLSEEIPGTLITNTFRYTYNYWDLKPDTEYTFYVRGWHRLDGDPVIFVIDIKTAALGSTEIPNVDIEYGKADFYQQEYTITPNAKCKQIVLRQTSRGGDGATMAFKYGYAGDVMTMYDIWKDVDVEGDLMKCYTAKDKTLVAKTHTKDLVLDAELDLYVIVYDENYKPAGVKKLQRKLPGKNPDAKVEDMTLTISPIKATQEAISFKIDTNEAVRSYIYDIYNDAEYKKVRNRGDFDPMTSFQQDMVARPSSTMWAYDLRSESYTNTEIAFVIGATYHVIACPTNENGPYGDGFGEFKELAVTITE